MGKEPETTPRPVPSKLVLTDITAVPFLVSRGQADPVGSRPRLLQSKALLDLCQQVVNDTALFLYWLAFTDWGRKGDTQMETLLMNLISWSNWLILCPFSPWRYWTVYNGEKRKARGDERRHGSWGGLEPTTLWAHDRPPKSAELWNALMNAMQGWEM